MDYPDVIADLCYQISIDEKAGKDITNKIKEGKKLLRNYKLAIKAGEIKKDEREVQWELFLNEERKQGIMTQAIATQELSKQALAQTIEVATDTVEIGKATLEEMAIQNEKLKRTYEAYDNIDVSLKAAGKHILTLSRRSVKDKILISFICLSFLALICLILVFVFYPNQQVVKIPTYLCPQSNPNCTVG